jgi:DNA topoisomerase-3
MEDAAVKAGFANLKDGGDFDNLAAAASCRERADWCVGLNNTRLFSVLYGVTLNTGRVQSPTLAMLVKREADISAFAKEPFYTPTLDLTSLLASGEKSKDKAEAEAIAAACEGRTATVAGIERARKTAAPPKLYDLTSLQRDANRLLGYTAQQTLDYVQALYEKKTVSYPRTDARFITADMIETVRQVIGNIGFEPDIGRLVGPVSDHHAIIPTLESKTVDTAALPGGERETFMLVRDRLTAAVSPKHVYETVTATFACNGNSFTAKGKTVIEAGWKTRPDEGGDDGDGETAASLPELSEGQAFDGAKAFVKEGSTAPPKHYTEDTLLAAMESAGAEDMPEDAERKGLGTPATRAAIIEKLVKAGFAERSKKNLLPTEKGKNLIAVLPESLASPKMTAEWEHRLKQVERGELSGEAFMDGIAGFVQSIVKDNPAPNPDFTHLFPSAAKSAAEDLGPCPRCKSPVREGEKGFFCDSGACGFKMWKASKFWTAKRKALTAAIVSELLKNGRAYIKGLYSEKTGKEYAATVILDDAGDGFVNFRMEFDKKR